MESNLRQTLISLAVNFAGFEGCALSTVSRRCRNDSGFFHRLSDPTKSFTVRTFDEVVQWFSKNWPVESEWPSGVDRPAVSAAGSLSPDSTSDGVSATPAQLEQAGAA
jgi:hypothetical protein